MRYCLAALILLPYLASATPTLRLDYIHSGKRGEESFSVDAVVIEPLPWPGNPARAIDGRPLGKYLVELRAADDGALLFSQSFSSIYGEWETTAEATRFNRGFHESVRFPDPGRIADVVISKRGPDNSFAEVWRHRLDPDDYMNRREAARFADAVVAIQQRGDPAQKVDLLMLGDGYTADEHDDFIATATALTEALFATSPFRERRDDFNVWALAPPAAESGVSRPSTGTWRDSPLGTTFDAFRSERYVLTLDNARWRRVAASAPYDAVEILVNAETYGGGGIYGLYATAAANSDWAEYLFIHEFGHHFVGLADEYYTSAVAYEDPEVISEPYEPNVTALLDPAQLKWRHLVDGSTPLPTAWPKAAFETHSLAVQERRAQLRADDVPEEQMNALFRYTRDFVDELFADSGQAGIVGAFEGANYQATGFYRPQQNCLMFTRTDYFCAVCGEAIESRIDHYVLAAEPE